MLAVLFHHVDTRNIHHVDHVFPQALVQKSKLRQLGMDWDSIDDLQSKRDELPNLQLLEGVVNITKSDTLPAAWAQSAFHTPEQHQAYLDRNQIPWLPASTDEFESFFEDRRKALAQLIRTTLAAPSIVPEGEESAVSGGSEESALSTSIEEELAESAFND